MKIRQREWLGSSIEISIIIRKFLSTSCQRGVVFMIDENLICARRRKNDENAMKFLGKSEWGKVFRFQALNVKEVSLFFCWL
jgi:hypothetical protein